MNGLVNLRMPGTWSDRGACRGVDPNVFHPVRGADLAEALSYCDACPVRAECLAHALRFEPNGVWGGTSGRQRKQIRRRSGITLADFHQHDLPETA